MPEPLILLPSQLCNEHIWDHQVDALADIADVRPTAPPDGDSMQQLAAALLDSAPEHFALVAHGMGGFVAFEALRRAPERITRLALLGTLASADGPAQLERRAGYLRLVEAGRFDEVVEERIPLLFHPDHARDPALTEVARSMARETGPERFLRQQRAIMGRIDSRPSLRAIRCPTLVVGGDADGVAPPAAVRELADGIPGARLEMIERCGHFMPLEQPAALNALLRAWLLGEWD